MQKGLDGHSALLRVSGACKSFRTPEGGVITALDGVDLAIRNNEFLTLLGPSGCGKTTLLKVIAGFEDLNAGEIDLDGSPMGGVPAHRRPFNTVFQNYALFPHMTVDGNVGYGLDVAGLPRAERDRRVAAMLALVGLEGMERRKPAQLSGGQQQRVAVARAVVLQPQVLLFDEPLSNLDAKLRRHVREEIRELQQKLGITAVYVTHDQAEALAISDRVIVMRNAAIAQDGTPRELYEAPADRFVADFIGDANIVEAEIAAVEGEAAEVRLGHATLRLPRRGLQPGAALVAIRPASIQLSAAPAPGRVAGRVLKASYLGSHVEYELGTEVGELFAVDPDATRLLAPETEVGIGFADRGVTLIPGS